MKLKVKFFGSQNALKTSFTGKKLFFNEIEKEINTWLLVRPDIEIVKVQQSAAGGDLTTSKLLVSIWYRENA